MLLTSILFFIYIAIADSGTRPDFYGAWDQIGRKESPDDECSATLNHSDCGLSPIMVYTSFSPMAMCHAAIWRGCPTKNKFATEYQCMQSCLADNEVGKGRCDIPINTSRCSDQTRQVYTFSVDKKACVKAIWHGCPSENMFTDKTSCMNACNMPVQWGDTLTKMDISELKETSTLLNNLIKKIDALENKRIKSDGRITKEDSSARAYFILKLHKVHRELDARTEKAYTDLLLLDDM